MTTKVLNVVAIYKAVLRSLVAFYLIALIVSPVSSSDVSDTVLAAQALNLYQQSESSGHKNGETLFRVSLILERITTDFPKSITALRIKKNKFKGIDVGVVERLASEWERLNKNAAQGLKSATVAPQPKPTPLVSSANTPPSTPSLVTIAPPVASPPPSTIEPTQSAGIPKSDPRPTKISRKDVVNMLKGSTVMLIIMTPHEGSVRISSMGSGFFINKTQILTNAHVVRGSAQIIVASEEMGLGTGRVIAVGQTSKGLGTDAAVVEVVGISPVEILTFAHSVFEGDSVAIGGFPGNILDSDQKVRKLVSFINERIVPSREDVPSARFSFGAIEGVYKDLQGNDNIQHGLETTGGNSGSPIVNACGHVVGLHFSGRSSKNDNSKFNYAHSFLQVEKFLRSNGIEYSRGAYECDQG